MLHAERVPAAIASKMDSAGIKSVDGVARAAGLPRITIRRILDGQSGHRALTMYKRQAEALGWTLDEYFKKAMALEPEEFGIILTSRLKSKGYTPTSFGKLFSCAETGRSYTRGNVKFKSLRNYAAICSVLGMSAESLYESLLTFKPVVTMRDNDTILKSAVAKVKANSTVVYQVLLTYLFKQGPAKAPA